MDERDLFIAEPCTESWDAMEERPGGRHCNVCNMQVYDLSSMTQEEASACLASRGHPSSPEGRRLCIRYTMDEGQVVFRDPPKRRLPVVAIALPLAFAACAPQAPRETDDSGIEVRALATAAPPATPPERLDPSWQASPIETADAHKDAPKPVPTMTAKPQPPVVRDLVPPRPVMGAIAAPPTVAPPPPPPPTRIVTMGEAPAVPTKMGKPMPRP